MTRPLTPEMAARWPNVFEVRYKGNGLWTSSCPTCRDEGHIGPGKVDRFQIYEAGTGTSGKARGWCRQCGEQQFVDDNNKQIWTPQRKLEAEALRRESARVERERLKQKIEWLQHQTFWLHWHEQMTLQQRELWHKEGISDWAIEAHKLGFSPPKDPSESGAMSIPYFNHEDIQTLQLRLLSPPTPEDKYRFIKGTCAAWFKPDPDKDIEDVVLVLEGAKKALVAYQNMSYSRYKDRELTIMASPAKDVPHRLFKELEQAKTIIWLLDPDAYKAVKGSNGKKRPPAIKRNIQLAGQNKSLVVRTVAKIDDMFTQYGLKSEAFHNMINQAGPLRV